MKVNLLTDEVVLEAVSEPTLTQGVVHARYTVGVEQVSVAVWDRSPLLAYRATTPDPAPALAAALVDVARATARATVQAIVADLGPHLDDCDESDLGDVEERLQRYADMLCASVDDHERLEAARHYAAALLCARAVRR